MACFMKNFLFFAKLLIKLWKQWAIISSFFFGDFLSLIFFISTEEIYLILYDFHIKTAL